MGADLVATALPRLTEREYYAAIDNADARSLATAAYHASYQGNFGDDVEFTEHVVAQIADEEPDIIDELAERPSAVEAIRVAARSGARYVLERMDEDGKFVVDASRIGGPDVIVVGGSTFGDDPFDQFRDVAVLAAILAASSSLAST
ncbi:hypothetical protein [Lentzea sp. NBRC 102530]|uniref:hypothetical protein n=1 Tax=Lentzea sp. NBRC 102530 TaxID=3032201 RepID=UPI0024A2BAFA|nr:hypothetical protein [Lentzea sp. NBRC 102530]GLY54858.1 hypothetical protein Lesp01_85130 [Lentzea sp. NBRC 102530]